MMVVCWALLVTNFNCCLFVHMTVITVDQSVILCAPLVVGG